MPDKPHKDKQTMQQDLFDKESTVTDNCSQRERAVMYCDGASSGNPGESGIGVVIYIVADDVHPDGEGEVYRISEYIGVATNNVAEYSALITGLKKARSLGVKKIRIYLDSELLVRQINGIYKVKNSKLIPLWAEAVKILKEFDEYKMDHVRREKNQEADALARQGVKKNAGG
jgi:ribonuclease HI